MSHIDEKKLFLDWLSNTKAAYPTDNTVIQETIENALNLPRALDDNLEKLMREGIIIADTLMTLSCDAETVAAGLIYPLFQAASKQSINTESFNHIVLKLLNGVIRMGNIHATRNRKTTSDAQQKQINSLRKMLLAIVDDMRTVLIKLAEQLAYLQSIKEAPLSIQQKAAQTVMDFYAPLANRLGIGQIKWQLEDWAFRYLNNQTYKEISKALTKRRADRVAAINTMLAELHTLFEGEANFKRLDITGRAKHIYSIHKKLTRKQLPFSELYDTNAMRILVPSVKDCYSALSLVHAKWPHIQKEFDDYIANPKPNGYQSIHTAITKEDGSIFEVQIRTFKMHEKAELGVAAHWKYKESDNTHDAYAEKISLLREVISWQQEISTNHETESLYQQAFQDRVYVFSPTGDIYELPHGATPLDFAYLLHTDVGHRCKGAKINGKLAPLQTTLKTGNQVEIITSKEAKPSRDWMRPELKFLATTHAIKKVKHWFRQLDHDEKLATGSSLWDKTAKQQGLGKVDLTQVAKHFNFKNTEGLLIALGSGDIHASNIVRHLKTEKTQSTDLTKASSFDSKALTTQNENCTQINTDVLGTNSLLTQLAKCCSPIPGDEIIGYITKNKGISIHCQDCKNLQKKLQKSPERIIPIAWKDEQAQSYRLRVTLTAETHPELEKDLSSLTLQMQTPILAIESFTKKNKPITSIQLTLEIKDKKNTKDILQRLRQLSHVIEVNRR